MHIILNGSHMQNSAMLCALFSETNMFSETNIWKPHTKFDNAACIGCLYLMYVNIEPYRYRQNVRSLGALAVEI